MNKDRFVAAMTRRGYEVETLGKMVICRSGNYTAIHFFNADGSPDETQKPYWTMKRGK